MLRREFISATAAFPFFHKINISQNTNNLQLNNYLEEYKSDLYRLCKLATSDNIEYVLSSQAELSWRYMMPIIKNLINKNFRAEYGYAFSNSKEIGHSVDIEINIFRQNPIEHLFNMCNEFANYIVLKLKEANVTKYNFTFFDYDDTFYKGVYRKIPNKPIGYTRDVKPINEWKHMGFIGWCDTDATI